VELLRRARRRLLDVLREQTVIVAAYRVPLIVKAAVSAHPNCLILFLAFVVQFVDAFVVLEFLYRTSGAAAAELRIGLPHDLREMPVDAFAPCAFRETVRLEAADDYGLRKIVEVLLAGPGLFERSAVVPGRIFVGDC
jgi:hypothetical protein